MATNQLDCVLDHVRKLIGIQRETELTDGELLEQFLARQDESAFETLVRRHGPMVQRVCRRVLGDAHAAEDAFQATFLVLARKAASIRRRGSLGGWLYEVAYHLAVRSKADAARRFRHERRAIDMPTADTISTEERQELQAVVDEELQRLPEKYRTPLVLCYLEGKTNVQAARELGWPTGSMSSRLARAREVLRDKLTGRGVAVSAGGLAGLLGENAASAAVPAVLVQNTVQAAVLFAAGKTSVAGLASAQAVVLAEGMLNTMITFKLKLVAAVVLAVGILGTSTSALVQRGALAQAPAAAAAEPKAEGAQPAAADGKKNDKFGDPLPDGALARMGTLRWRHGGAVTFVGYIDGGKQLVTGCADGFFRVWEVSSGKLVRRFGNGQPVADANSGWAVAGNVGAFIGVGGAGGGGSVALSADGQTLAASGADGIKLYETATGKDIRKIGLQQGGVGGGRVRGYYSSLTFSPDGKTLASRGNDQMIYLWEVASGKEIRKIGKQPNNNNGVRFFVVGGAAGGNSLAFSPDGKNIASAGAEFDNMGRGTGLVQFYEVESGKELHQIKAKENNNFGVAAVAFTPDGKSLAWASGDGTTRLYEAESGKEMKQMGQAQQGVFINTLVYSPDGKVLATRSSNSAGIQLWDVENGKELRVLGEQANDNNNAKIAVAIGRVGGGASPQAVAFSPDGKTLAEGLPSHSVRLWEVATGKEVLPASGHQGGVSSMSVSPDGKVLTTYGADNTIRQWDMQTGQEKRQFKLPAAGNVALSADGSTVVCGAANNAVQIWDVATGKEVRTVTIPNQQNFAGLFGGAGGLALSPDGKVVAIRGFDATIHMYETATGKEMTPLAQADANAANPGGGFVIAAYGSSPVMAFSPDGKTLATLASPAAGVQPGVIINGRAQANPGSVIQLWNVTVGKPMKKFDASQRGIAGLAFSPSGQTIVSANGDNTISVWETLTGKECFVIQLKAEEPAAKPADPNLQLQKQVMMLRGGFGAASSPITSLEISPDGRTLAAGNVDRTIRLYDMAAGKELGQFKGHEGGVLKVVFAPDSRTVISGSADTTAVVWDGGKFIKKDAATVELEAKQVDDLWKDLAGDGAKAHTAKVVLSTAPKQALALLQERVKPTPGVDPKKLEQLVADLDSNNFDVRQKANAELEKLGELAEPALQKVLKSQPGLETRQRIDKLLESLATGQAPPPEVLRSLRAVEVLEQIGTPEAKQVLETLAKGAPGDKLTRQAESALKRLGK